MKWLAALLVFGVAVVAAEPTETAPVDDKAGVIADADEPALNGEVRALRDAGVKLAVIILRTTGGAAIESVAIDARGRWYTGSDGAAVFILAIDDRQSRLEVNDALRPKFPDSRAQLILDNIRGYLRAADYAGAIRAVVREIRSAATGQPIDSENPHPPVADPPVHGGGTTAGTTSEPKKSRAWIWIVIVVGILLAGGAVWAMSSRKRALTLSHDGVRHQRPFVADWLWSALKIVGVLLWVVAMVAMASGSSRTSSSRSWGSSSSGSRSSSSSGSSGGGWSGGGASSRW
ncbi:MAG TPA: TPM domain-containing protein [Kofleriaceae bacterium]